MTDFLTYFQLKERQQIVPYLEPTRGKTFVLFPPFGMMVTGQLVK
jgi:hypothetical protein